MSLLDLVVIGLIIIGVVLWVGEPLLRRVGTPEGTPETDEREALSFHKEMLYTAIRDLTFDFHAGKVDNADYAALRQQLEAEAIQVLQELDALTRPASVEDEIERQVSVLRQSGTVISADAQVCPSCQGQLVGHENFCPTCGEAIILPS